MIKKTATPEKSHGRSTIKVYLLLMTLLGAVWWIIGTGILLFNIGKQIIMTDEEYILWNRYYELEACEQSIYKPTKNNQNNYVMPTKEEETTCKEEKKEQLKQARKAEFKENVIGGWIRAILFGIILLIHYPKFMKARKQ